MRRSLVLMISVALAAGLALAEEVGRLDQKVLWRWEAPEVASFVPEAMLQRLDLNELPISKNERKRLESSLSRVNRLQEREKACADGTAGCPQALPMETRVERELQKLEWDSVEQREGLRRMIERSLRSADEWKAHHPGPCQYASNAGIHVPRPEAFDFEEHLELSPAVFRGRVVETVVGWSTRTHRVGTMVYVEIEEVFRDEHGHLWPGKLVAYEQPAGDVRLRGARLCTIPEPGRTLVEAGDQVLAFGVQHAADHVWSEVSWVYPIVDGQVLPQPLVPDSGIEPVPLTRFREICAAAEAPEVGR